MNDAFVRLCFVLQQKTSDCEGFAVGFNTLQFMVLL